MFAKKKTTKREQRLLVLLPAALILALYTFLIAIPRQRELRQQTARFQKLEQIAVQPVDAENSKLKLKHEQLTLSNLQESVLRYERDSRQISERWRTQESRLDAVQKLTELMEQYNLSISSQDYEENPKLSSYFKEVCQIIDGQFPESPLEFWQVELEGKYVDVISFLAAVKISNVKTIPLTLSMTASPSNDGQNRLTITFMI